MSPMFFSSTRWTEKILWLIEDAAAAGLVFSGIYTKENLVEFVELPADVHPFYVGTQAHPELKSRPTRPHPLFIGLIASAIALKGKK